MGQTWKAILEGMNKPQGQTTQGQTTHLMKLRFPPTWSRQSFEKAKNEERKLKNGHRVISLQKRINS